MRTRLTVVGIALAVSIIVVLIAWATFDLKRYRAPIRAELERRLGRRVSLAEMCLTLFPPSFRVKNLRIAEDSDFSPERPFVQA